MKSGGYVLVVDDEPDIRELVRDVLEIEGYPVATASDGREALAHLQCADPPGLILLDLMMPIMNGWEFRAAQLKDPRLQSIPVVVLSGDGSTSEKARKLGSPKYVTKPIHLDRLLSLVRDTLQGPVGKPNAAS